MKYFRQHLVANNDPNGNPQRLFLFYDEFGRVKSVTDEGYCGTPQGFEESIDVHHSIVELPSMEISKSDYHWWIKQGKRVGSLGVIT